MTTNAVNQTHFLFSNEIYAIELNSTEARNVASMAFPMDTRSQLNPYSEDYRYKELVESFVELSTGSDITIEYQEGAARKIIHIGFRNNDTS
jgi:hypothetical protein